MSKSKRRILVVEDSPDLRALLHLYLQGEDVESILASNGAEALEILNQSSKEARPSVILLDLMMPVMDGFEFRTEQLKNPAIAQIPVVIMTAGRELETESKRFAAFAALKKPLDIDELRLILDRAFSAKTQAPLT